MISMYTAGSLRSVKRISFFALQSVFASDCHLRKQIIKTALLPLILGWFGLFWLFNVFFFVSWHSLKEGSLVLIFLMKCCVYINNHSHNLYAFTCIVKSAFPHPLTLVKSVGPTFGQRGACKSQTCEALSQVWFRMTHTWLALQLWLT